MLEDILTNLVFLWVRDGHGVLDDERRGYVKRELGRALRGDTVFTVLGQVPKGSLYERWARDVVQEVLREFP